MADRSIVEDLEDALARARVLEAERAEMIRETRERVEERRELDELARLRELADLCVQWVDLGMPAGHCSAAGQAIAAKLDEE